MTLLSLKRAERRPNRTFPNSRYTPVAFLLQIKANNCPFPWQSAAQSLTELLTANADWSKMMQAGDCMVRVHSILTAASHVISQIHNFISI